MTTDQLKSNAALMTLSIILFLSIFLSLIYFQQLIGLLEIEPEYTKNQVSLDLSAIIGGGIFFFTLLYRYFKNKALKILLVSSIISILLCLINLIFFT